MVTVDIIDADSPYLEAVRLLWRSHSNTLGFFPGGAFIQFACERHILVALDGQRCVGYLIYRIAGERVSIVHFCVAPDARRQGVGRAMLNRLIAATRQQRGIILSCRRDFDASTTWPRLGFHALDEKVGRAADGSLLDRWVLDYGHATIFNDRETEALELAIDYNIFLDLIEERNEETQGLEADWLRPFVSLCYTPELLNEIRRNDDAEIRARRRREIQRFKQLRCTPEEYQKAESTLKPLFLNLVKPQDESDFRHLVNALATDADAFVTRDDELLERADDVFKVCGLPIDRPAGIVGRIDSIEHERDYQRNFVAGTRRIIQERINCADDAIIAAIQSAGEQKRKLLASLNTYLAAPQHSRCHKVSDTDGAILAVYVVQRDAGIDRVPMFRVCGGRRANSIARSILAGLIRQAASSLANAVIVAGAGLSEVVQSACADLGFLPLNEGWAKVVGTGWLAIDDVPARLTWPDAKFDDVKAALPQAKTDAVIASQLEHLLWPAKLADANLPCFIVPIRPDFAEHLFDQRLADGALFGPDVDLALNSESVYYRAAQPAILTCPARVLWYVSEQDTYKGSKAIRASSRLVEIAIGTPKELYKRFRRLGVYDWLHVFDTAKHDVSKKIMAFRFDDSEQLKPVPWDTFQAILKANGITNNLQCPVAIPPSVFGKIYALSLNPPQAC
jgi:GNAT superfamily N-acetyltransferase